MQDSQAWRWGCLGPAGEPRYRAAGGDGLGEMIRGGRTGMAGIASDAQSQGGHDDAIGAATSLAARVPYATAE
jgi:hypothetical protein